MTKEELVKDVKMERSLGCSDHDNVKLRILREVIKIKSRIKSLNLKRSDFGLFRDLLGKIPQDTALEAKEARASA